MTQQVDVSFSELVHAAISGESPLRGKLDSKVFTSGVGGHVGFSLPTMKLAIAPDSLPEQGIVGRIQIPSDTDVLPLVTTVEVRETTGRVLVGTGLPGFTLQTADTTSGAGQDPAFGTVKYSLDVVAEAVTETSFQATVQNLDIYDDLEVSHRLTLAQALERLILLGDGSGATATSTVTGGVVSAVTVVDGGLGYITSPEVRIIGDGTGAEAVATIAAGAVDSITITEAGTGYSTASVVIGSGAYHLAAGRATYATADAGGSDAFLLGEETIMDAQARRSGMAWVTGRTLDSAASSTLLEPGADRRTSERGVFSLTGTPSFRSSDLPDNDALLFDWRQGVVLVLHDSIDYTVNNISRPGWLKLTSRLNVDVVIVRPTMGYLLSQA